MITLSLALLQASTQADAVVRNYLPAGKSAYYALPAELIASGKVLSAVWSGDGTTLVFERAEPVTRATLLVKQGPPAVNELMAWNVKTRKLKSLVKFPSEGMTPLEMEILNDRHLIVNQSSKVMAPGKVTLAIIDLTTGSFRPLVAAPLVVMSLSVSRLKMTAGIRIAEPRSVTPPMSDSTQKESILFVNSKGQVTGPFLRETPGFLQFDTDSEAAYMIRYVKSPTGKRVMAFATVDPKTGTETPYIEPKGSPLPSEPLFSLQRVQVPMVVNGKSRPVSGLTFHYRGKDRISTDPSLIVSTDSTIGWHSPTGAAVAFASQDGLYARELVKIPREDYQASLDAAEREELLRRARVVGTALMMFGGDNGDRFPATADFSQSISKYLKNPSSTEGFVYTFAGGDLTKVESPSTTVAGYIQGEYGRAILYVDGHTTWKKS